MHFDHENNMKNKNYADVFSSGLSEFIKMLSIM